MDWTDILIEVAQKDKEEACNIAAMISGAGLYIEDYSDLEEKVMEIAHVDLIEDELLKMPKNIVKIHIYVSKEENAPELCALLSERLNNSGISHKINTDGIKQEDWENSWKQYYHGMEIGKRLAVSPSWEEYKGSGRKLISLDPGMAFGTGTHETTLLCLEFLEREIQGGERVLDVGCGSGILAIASLLLGAKEAVGIDIDPVAVRVALENGERNNVSDRFFPRAGNLAEKADGSYNIICANIVASAIISLCPDIPALLEDKGKFIASGIIKERKNEVLEALEQCGLKTVEIYEKNSWVALVCVKAG